MCILVLIALFNVFLREKNSRGTLCKINCEIVSSFCEALLYEDAIVQGGI